jgi:hypothetical protein
MVAKNKKLQNALLWHPCRSLEVIIDEASAREAAEFRTIHLEELKKKVAELLVREGNDATENEEIIALKDVPIKKKRKRNGQSKETQTTIKKLKKIQKDSERSNEK